jgi:hypothetical protein
MASVASRQRNLKAIFLRENEQQTGTDLVFSIQKLIIVFLFSFKFSTKAMCKY